MRVLLIHPVASYAVSDVESGLRTGLKHHGVEVIPYRLDQRIHRSEAELHYQWRRMKKVDPSIESQRPNAADVFYHAGVWSLEMALRNRVDAVLIVSSMFFHPEALRRLLEARLKVFVLFTESPYDIEKELKIAAMVHGCWTNERSAVSCFRAVNPNSGYLPHAWNPDVHKPGPQHGDEQWPEHDVVFVGTCFRERIEWFSSVDWSGIDLGLYGTWDELGSRHHLRQYVKGAQIDNSATVSLYRRAKIGLNFYRKSIGWGRHAPQIAHAESLNPRAYELAACGAFHLSDDRAEVREVFGDCVPTFSSPTEAGALIRRWLADADERAQMAANLPACVAESTWINRAATVIGDLKQLLDKRAA